MRTEGLRDKSFCSERCFTHFRRAMFKKTRGCDWCRRPAEAFVTLDLDNKAGTMQFCSEACRAQYSMDLICRETKARLDINPELRRLFSDPKSLMSVMALTGAPASAWLTQEALMAFTSSSASSRSVDEDEKRPAVKVS